MAAGIDVNSPIPREEIKVDSKQCFEYEGRRYYLKEEPSMRASGGVDPDACLKEVLASKLFRYLLGDRSPVCRLVVLNEKPYSVASEFIEATKEFGEGVYGAALKPLLPELAEVFAAAYLLGETDLNTQSIQIKEKRVHKIDHDRALQFEHFPLEPGSPISVFTFPASFDEIISWCGFSAGTRGDVPSFKGQLEACNGAELDEVNAAARRVFEKMQGLSDAEIAGMVADVGFTEAAATVWMDTLIARRDACCAFMEAGSSVSGITPELLAAKSPRVCSSLSIPTTPMAVSPEVSEASTTPMSDFVLGAAPSAAVAAEKEPGDCASP